MVRPLCLFWWRIVTGSHQSDAFRPSRLTCVDYSRNNTEIKIRIRLNEYLPDGPSRQKLQQPRRNLRSLHVDAVDKVPHNRLVLLHCTRTGRGTASSVAPAGAAEGSAEFKPRGITGTFTIKMMSKTSKTSISGVTLTSEERPSPPEAPVVENAIAVVPQCRIG